MWNFTMNVTHQINNPSCLGHYLHTNLSLGKGSGVGWSRLQLLILFGCVILDLCILKFGPFFITGPQQGASRVLFCWFPICLIHFWWKFSSIELDQRKFFCFAFKTLTILRNSATSIIHVLSNTMNVLSNAMDVLSDTMSFPLQKYFTVLSR